MLVAVRVADDLQAVAMLSEAVDERDDASCAGERVAPLLEGEVGGDDRRALLVSPADDVVEDVRSAGVARKVPKLVEDQYVRSGVATDTSLEGRQRFLVQQIRERGGERREPHGEPGGERGVREILRRSRPELISLNSVPQRPPNGRRRPHRKAYWCDALSLATPRQRGPSGPR